MTGPAYWGIAGHPISHSLTPRLFELVGRHVGIEGPEAVFIDADGIEEFMSKVTKMEGDVWLSCTAPLKHSPQGRLGVSGPEGVNAINQLKRIDGEWSGTSTDGAGFVDSCRHVGVEPSESTLRMRGGGSAAGSIAAAWACFISSLELGIPPTSFSATDNLFQILSGLFILNPLYPLLLK